MSLLKAFQKRGWKRSPETTGAALAAPVTGEPAGMDKQTPLPFAEAALHALPGFDQRMHDSPVVDWSIELQDGKRAVVYRTKPEITASALRRFTALNFKP